MKMIKLIVKCQLCDDYVKYYFDLEHTGFDHDSFFIEDKKAWCEKHKPVKQFVETQCTSCLDIWKRCSLWGAKDLDNLCGYDFAKLEKGKCPFYVGKIDGKTAKSPVESGKVLSEFFKNE